MPHPILVDELLKLRARLKQRRADLLAKAQDDPTMRMIVINTKFNKFLETTRGPARTSPESVEIINQLGKELDQAKEDAKSWDINKILDESYEVARAVDDLNWILNKEQISIPKQ